MSTKDIKKISSYLSLIFLCMLMPAAALAFPGNPEYEPPVPEISSGEDLMNKIIEEHFQSGSYGIDLLEAETGQDNKKEYITFTYTTPSELFGIIDISLKRTVTLEISSDGHVEIQTDNMLFQNLITSVQNRYLMERIESTSVSVIANYNAEQDNSFSELTRASTVINL